MDAKIENPLLSSALHARASGFVDSIGAEFFSYIVVKRPFAMDMQSLAMMSASYPAEWITRYRDFSYHNYDPVVAHAREAYLPFAWGHRGFLQQCTKSQAKLFHEAHEFGIVEGLSIPVHGPLGEAGLFSIVAKHRGLIADIQTTHSAPLQAFAIQLHADAMVPYQAAEPAAIMLSSRERDCLMWTLEGMTTAAIADRMCLSVSAVNYHFTNVIQKLGAANKYHAAIVAMKKRLV